MNLLTLRQGLLAIIILVLGMGYAASQWFYFQGRAAEYARVVDVPSIRTLALILLLMFVVFAFIPVRESEIEA